MANPLALSCRQPFRGHDSPVLTAVLANDGERVLSCSSSGQLLHWDSKSGRVLREIHEQEVVQGVLFPCGTKAASTDKSGGVSVWHLESGHQIRHFVSSDGKVADMAAASDELLITVADATLCVWDVENDGLNDQHQPLRKILQSNRAGVGNGRVAAGHGMFASSFDDSYAITLWSLTTLRAVASLVGHTSVVSSISLASDKLVASSSDDSTVRLWLRGDGSCIQTIKWSEPLPSCGLAPNGKWLIVAGCSDAYVCDTVSCRVVAWLKGHSSYVFPASFSGDGRRMITTSGNAVRVWSSPPDHLSPVSVYLFSIK